jgi:Fibronectin type III domain/Putative Ig domain
VPVTFTISPAGAATFSGIATFTVNTAADGTARTPFVTAGQTPGDVTVAATVTGLAPATFPLGIVGANTTPPGPPTIDSVTGGDGSIVVRFTPGVAGSAPTTGYRVVATDTGGGGTVTVEGPASPITVTPLTNGRGYIVTVTALSTDGNSAASAPSDPLTVGIPASITGSPPAATVGRPYSFTFTIAGIPAPDVSVDPSTPLGLSFDPTTGVLSGTATNEGSTPLTLHADNALASPQLQVTLVVRGSFGTRTHLVDDHYDLAGKPRRHRRPRLRAPRRRALQPRR